MTRKAKANCYCAFCKSPKRMATQKNIRVPQFLGCILIAVGMTYLLFQQPDLRGLLILAVLLLLTELFYVLRWRASVICRICGFDPIIYRKSPSLAAEKVKFQLDKRQNDPVFMLKRPLDLPKISQQRKDEIEKNDSTRKSEGTPDKGLIVSKSV